MRRATALALIRSLDIDAALRVAHREVTRVDLERTQELMYTARREELAAGEPTGPGSAGAAAKTAGRPGAQPRSTGGAA